MFHLHREAMSSPRVFDVICAGETVWHLDASRAARSSANGAPLVPHRGALRAAYQLARRRLAVGLATTLTDDTAGRALLSHLAAASVDTSGVTLAHPSADLVLADGTAVPSTQFGYTSHATVAVPAHWSARVLLLSGLSPHVAHMGSLCQAARCARRAGTAVVIDVNARRGVWAGHDPRTVRMVLREADIVHGSDADLAALGVDAAELQGSLRPSGTLAITYANGEARVVGPFGVFQRKREPHADDADATDTWPAAICAALAQQRGDDVLGETSWARLVGRDPTVRRGVTR